MRASRANGQNGPFSTIIDFPASFHNGAAGFSFADGHAEIHRWIGKTISRRSSMAAPASGTEFPPALAPGTACPMYYGCQMHTSAAM